MSQSSALPLTQTYRLLGLTTAAIFGGLGVLEYLDRPYTTRLFCGDAATDHAQKHGDTIADTLMKAISARDVSLGLALGLFHYYRMPRAQGILILSSLWFLLVDLRLFYQAHGPQILAFKSAGVATCAWVGWELLRRS